MIKRKNIGIDIDDTITNSSEVFIKYAKQYNKEHGIEFRIDTTQLDVSKAFGWSDDNYKEFVKTYLKEILTEAQPKEYAIDVIKRLQDEGHRIILITARHERELDDPYIFTKRWLELNNVNYDKLIVNSKKKAISCLENGVEIYIDDNYRNCMETYKELHIPVFLFDTVYNKNNKISSWPELYLKIKKICRESQSREEDTER